MMPLQQYIIWDRLGQSNIGSYPCTGGEMYVGRRIHYLGLIRSEHTWLEVQSRYRFSPIRGCGIRGSVPLEVWELEFRELEDREFEVQVNNGILFG